MAWNRREFLALLAAGVAGVHAQARPPQRRPDGLIFAEEDKTGFSILQGMTDETSAQFSLVLPKNIPWSVTVQRSDGLHAPLAIQQEIFAREYSDFAVYRLLVEGLELRTNYVLSVSDVTGHVHDRREFRALDLSPRSVRLGFVSCALDILHRDDIYVQLEQQNPDMIFFLGDNVYADRVTVFKKRNADERQLWTRYVETRNRVRLYYQKRLTPVLATWDDHDFGRNNGTREFPHREAARICFETFFPQTERPALQNGPGIAKRFIGFGADFYLLDGRYFRDNPALRERKLLGATQEKWLFSKVDPGKASWLLNGSMFFGAYTGKDSFEGVYANDFQSFKDKLRASDGLFCFGSGDVHFSEVMDLEEDLLGYKSFEMVSSSIHSMAIPGHEMRFSNPRRRRATGHHNFTVFDGVFYPDRVEGSLTAFSAARKVYTTPAWLAR